MDLGRRESVFSFVLKGVVASRGDSRGVGSGVGEWPLVSGCGRFSLAGIEIAVADVVVSLVGWADVSGEYMRVNSSLIWDRVAFVKSIRMSMRPGRIRASSSFPGKLLVITKTRPSWEATPSIALRRPESEMP